MAISVDVIPNRSSPPAIQLRQAWRDGPRIRRRTIANLSKMPPAMVDAIRAMLKGGVVFASIDEAVTIRRALPHGHVAATLGTLRALGMSRILDRKGGRMRDFATGAIVARLLDPGSKLACARALSPETASSSLGRVLGLGPVHGMTTLLADLATLTLNEVMLPKSPDHVFEMLAQPTPLQRRAFELLEIDPARIVASTSPG